LDRGAKARLCPGRQPACDHGLGLGPGAAAPRAGPADKVERWAIDRLIPYAKNARTHTDAQVAAIAASIKEYHRVNEGGRISGISLEIECRAGNINVPR
jgi:hypothetical protein